VNPNDTENIKIALNDGYDFSTRNQVFQTQRKGTAHIIKEHRPIVVPIIDGFRRSFDKKGLRMKRKGFPVPIIKEPLDIDYDNDSIDEIVES
jgi:hypothetical protein